MKAGKNIYRLVLSAMFLALALVLPFLTGQIKQLGNALCPMHLPVLLCGFFCGPWSGLAVGFIAPLLRFFLFGMPAPMPTGIAMCFELGTYGLISGLLYKNLPKKRIYVYVSLAAAMIAGRIFWATAIFVLFCIGKTAFNVSIIIYSAFIDAIPGIILQIVLVPVLVMVLKKYTYGYYYHCFNKP